MIQKETNTLFASFDAVHLETINSDFKQLILYFNHNTQFGGLWGDLGESIKF